MRLRTIHIGAVSILLVFFAPAFAQQAVDGSKIVQMRATIQRLEGLAGDTNIPLDSRQHLSELLFEKRGELHALLRQKRDSLRSELQNTTLTTERTNINETIRQLNREMQQVSGADAATSASAAVGETVNTQPPESAPSPPPPSGTVTNIALNLTGGATSAVAPPVAPQPLAAQPEAPVAAQDICAILKASRGPATRDYRREIQLAACQMRTARTGGGGLDKLDFRAYTIAIAMGLAGAKAERIAVPELTAQAEDASNAKNLGASGSSSGTTSLVSKAGIPAVFGFAVEHGALARTTDGTTVTFTGNPVGIVQTLAKKGFIDAFQDQDDFTKFLRKLSFGVSFDTSRGDQPGTFTADKQQLSGFSFKYNIIDQRDPRHNRHTDKWQELTRKQASKLADTLKEFVHALADPPGVPAFNTWMENANKALIGKTSFTEIESTLETEFAKLRDLELPPALEELVKQVATDFDDLLKERNKILNEISNGWIATLDYNNERPAGLPSLSNFRFLVEKGAYNGSIDFTGNASVTVYNSRPIDPTVQRLRDFRFAGQIDVPMGDVSKTGKFMLSFAGRYERLLNDEAIEGTTEVIRKGDIAVGQVKLTIPIRGTAMKIPLSISFANRTELIKEKEIRGNFGVTFDLDSLLAKFNPFSRP